jgi:hypothetical protein
MKKKLFNIADKKTSFLGSKEFVLSTDLASDGSRNNIAVMLKQVTELVGLNNHNGHHAGRPISLDEADAATSLKDYCALSSNKTSARVRARKKGSARWKQEQNSSQKDLQKKRGKNLDLERAKKEARHSKPARKGTKTAPPEAASVSRPIGKLSTKEERGKQSGELAKKASRAKRRKACMPNSAVQARDVTARLTVGSIARKVESSFTTTTAPQADDSLTLCLSLQDQLHANGSPSGMGLRSKPRFTQLCAPHNFESSTKAASIYSETHEICIVHTAAEFMAQIYRSGSAWHPIRHTKDTITASNKHILNVPDSTRKKQRGFKRPRHQPSAKTYAELVCALSRVNH